ncbi:hypothetical protein RclHR1_01580014 [Rhizophagus clarus]|uniref:F-box domain-containing protein n=1 Tax=Rhizophagus clarus TaxID=94130 RepID=A0A2Z6QFY5_9GLOM|nr:hypothetical protein RclHR1_01580014 [Rhizophagus clarus]GES78640.1 hypothetical protein GLOIN_2v1764020 [Rhizophagus clarus]
MAKINKDILFSIFEELQEDSKSLFSCTLVNRSCCEIVIPILWKNPWRYNINYHDKNSLYSLIISYLTDDTNEFLTRQGISLPSISHQSLLFDYLSFCKSFDVEVLNSIISTGTLDLHKESLLQQEIYNLLISKCELKYLDIRSIRHQISYVLEAKDHFESLCELKCDTFVDSSYLQGLASICHYIQRLVIINKTIDVNYGLVKLIENQRNLKYFELRDDYDSEDLILSDPHKEIFLALSKKAAVLNHLIISFQVEIHYKHTIIQDVLAKLRKLKTLIINEFSITFSEDQLKTLVYRELETLNIDLISLNDASTIIENSGGQLREISLRFDGCGDLFCDSDFDEEDSLNFIRQIYKNCPLIERLSLLLSSKIHFIEFDKLLTTCQNLKLLLLSISYVNDKEETGEEILKILTRSAPIKLREIRFFDDIKFSLENLEEFFKNWKDRPALSILTSDFLYTGKDYVKLINKYKNNGVVENFQCYEFEKYIYY